MEERNLQETNEMRVKHQKNPLLHYVFSNEQDAFAFANPSQFCLATVVFIQIRSLKKLSSLG